MPPFAKSPSPSLHGKLVASMHAPALRFAAAASQVVFLQHLRAASTTSRVPATRRLEITA